MTLLLLLCILVPVPHMAMAPPQLSSYNIWSIAHDIAKSHLNKQIEAVPSISASPSHLSGKSGDVVVAWDKIAFQMKEDWIGLYCPGDSLNLSLFTAPITFKYASGSLQPDTMPTPSGTLVFHVPNYRQNCRFAYISGNTQFPELLAVSNLVEFDNYNMPMGVHIALGPGGDPTTLGVMWTQKSPDQPTVQYCGTSFADSTDTKQTCRIAVAASRTVFKSDFCDVDTQPAGREGWFPAGMLLNATLTGLVPGVQYSYAVGDASHTSSVYNFTAAPHVGPSQSVRIVAFGDMGNAPPDASHQHSWDFNNRGELPAPNTTLTVGRLLSAVNPSIALHIGDISYAVGYGAEWDQFLQQIEPVATSYAWQTAIGNHEYGYTASYYPSQDSGGECGAAYLAHFPFSCLDSSADVSEQQPWYSFEFGNVHVTVMSTEHDYSPSAPQWAWLEQDLASVNRSRTPWLLFSGHRPMYVSSLWDGDWEIAVELQNALEDMLVRHKVDLAIWGHFHAYQRTCPVVNSTCEAQRGVVHIVMGMAGYELTTLTPPSLPVWCAQALQDAYGAVALDFQSSPQQLQVTFVDNTGVVQDQVNIQSKLGFDVPMQHVLNSQVEA